MKKISIIGYGNIGSQIAFSLGLQNADIEIVIKDSHENQSKMGGKLLDIEQAFALLNSKTKIYLAEDYSDIQNSDAVIITAGVRRDPLIHKTREDLLKVNKNIIEDIAIEVKKNCPNAFIIIATNPIDVILHIFLQKSGINPKMVIGLSGTLDSIRLKKLLSIFLKKDLSLIETKIIGTHNNEMLPLKEHSKVEGKTINQLIKENIISENDWIKIENETISMGATIANISSVSAFLAPALCIIKLLYAFLYDKKEENITSVFLSKNDTFNSEIYDCCLGSSIILGKNGVEKIIKLELTEDEIKKLKISSENVKKLVCL